MRNGGIVTNIYHEVGKVGGLFTFLVYINSNLASKKRHNKK